VTAARIRVLIVDDHAVLRAGLRLLIDAQPDMRVVAEAADGAGAVTAAREHEPDVVLLDLTMPDGGTGAIERCLAAVPHTKVLVLTMHDDPIYARAAMGAGATGYVVKMAADTELLAAIRAVHSGRVFMDVRLSQRRSDPAVVAPASAALPPARLSTRERQVLVCLGQGFTNREIAERIKVGIKSVETYRHRLAVKLGLRRRADFVQYALHTGLLTEQSTPETP